MGGLSATSYHCSSSGTRVRHWRTSPPKPRELLVQRIKHPVDGANIVLGMADGAPHSTRCPYVPRRHALG